MATDTLAINGGPKALVQLGPFPTKMGREELWELLQMWEFDADTFARLKSLVLGAAHVNGPHLFRYYSPGWSRVEAAEKALRSLVGVQHCLATNSCTSALVASYRALGVGMGDEVIVPAYTFFATAATVASSNAVPVIADVDTSLNMDPDAVERAITKRTKAITPVHMRGAPAQMDAILEIGRRHGIPVVEDVAQACGGSFRGRRLGSLGTLGCFSFDYYKIAASGEGGFITTDDEWLYTRAQSWHDCAACWRPNRFARERREGELFCGENYRMSELEGAVALAQIRKLDGMLAGYRHAKQRIKSAIEPLPGVEYRRLCDETGDTGTCLVFYLPDPDITRKTIEALQAEGVPAGGIYDSKVRDWHVYRYWEHILDMKPVAPDGLPWSALPPADRPRYARDMCPRTLDLLARAVILDVGCHFSDEDCDAVAGAVNKVLRALLW